MKWDAPRTISIYDRHHHSSIFRGPLLPKTRRSSSVLFVPDICPGSSRPSKRKEKKEGGKGKKIAHAVEKAPEERKQE